MPNTSVANVAVCLGVSRATVVRIVKVLREKGLLHHEGPKKNGTWILNEVIVKSIKYPLTHFSRYGIIVR